jgi:hypothetical protein
VKTENDDDDSETIDFLDAFIARRAAIDPNLPAAVEKGRKGCSKIVIGPPGRTPCALYKNCPASRSRQDGKSGKPPARGGR